MTRDRELRRAFDASFAAPEPQPAAARERLLAVRVGDQVVALPWAALAGIHRLGAPAPVPGRGAGLLGIAAVGGVPLPVFDLAALLGREVAGAAPAWVAQVQGAPVGLAFAALLRQVEVPAAAREGAAAAAGWLRTVVAEDGAAWPVVEVERLVEHLGRRGSGAPAPTAGSEAAGTGRER